MICGIDAGAPPKTVFACQAGERGNLHGNWWTQRQPPVSVYTLVGAEKPISGKGFIRSDRTVASVVSPAGWGMAALFSVPITPDGMRVWIPTKEWKSKLFGASVWNAKKEVFCGWICQEFRLTDLDPEDESDQDDIDAIGLAEALSRFKLKELKKWQVRW